MVQVKDILSMSFIPQMELDDVICNLCLCGLASWAHYLPLTSQLDYWVLLLLANVACLMRQNRLCL